MASNFTGSVGATSINANITVEDNSEEVLKALKNAIERGLDAVGMAAEKNAKDEITKVVYSTPESPSYKRTGRLRNSITWQSDYNENSVYIGSNVEYAPYVELGTSRIPPRPFIRPAATQHTEEYKKLIKDSLENA